MNENVQLNFSLPDFALRRGENKNPVFNKYTEFHGGLNGPSSQPVAGMLREEISFFNVDSGLKQTLSGRPPDPLHGPL